MSARDEKGRDMVQPDSDVLAHFDFGAPHIRFESGEYLNVMLPTAHFMKGMDSLMPPAKGETVDPAVERANRVGVCLAQDVTAEIGHMREMWTRPGKIYAGTRACEEGSQRVCHVWDSDIDPVMKAERGPLGHTRDEFFETEDTHVPYKKVVTTDHLVSVTMFTGFNPARPPASIFKVPDGIPCIDPAGLKGQQQQQQGQQGQQQQGQQQQQGLTPEQAKQQAQYQQQYQQYQQQQYQQQQQQQQQQGQQQQGQQQQGLTPEQAKQQAQYQQQYQQYQQQQYQQQQQQQQQQGQQQGHPGAAGYPPPHPAQPPTSHGYPGGNQMNPQQQAALDAQRKQYEAMQQQQQFAQHGGAGSGAPGAISPHHATRSAAQDPRAKPIPPHKFGGGGLGPGAHGQAPQHPDPYGHGQHAPAWQTHGAMPGMEGYGHMVGGGFTCALLKGGFS
jgi:hypothetical protein